jgi:hypothetical protein
VRREFHGEATTAAPLVSEASTAGTDCRACSTRLVEICTIWPPSCFFVAETATYVAKKTLSRRRNGEIKDFVRAINYLEDAAASRRPTESFHPQRKGISRIKGLQLTAYGDPAHVVKLVDVPAPGPPCPGQVIIEVEASPIDPTDLYIIAGVYGELPPLPRRP